MSKATTNKVVEAVSLRVRCDFESGILYWKEKPVLVSQDKAWNNRYANKEAGNLCPDGYRHISIKIDGKERTVQAHRVIYFMYFGSHADQVDHINGICNDNRISNIRSVTASMNARNTLRKTRNVAKGVVKSPSGKFFAYIKISGKNTLIGKFDKEDIAAKAAISERIKQGFTVRHCLGICDS